MTTVEVSLQVAAPIERIWNILCHMETFPQKMKNVEKVEVLEQGPDWTVTAWRAKIQGGIFQWRERDVFDAVRHQIRYDQISGDLRIFRGEWRLEALVDNLTQVTLLTEFEFGMPMLAPILNPVARMAIRENATTMLQAIGKLAEN